MTRVAHTLLSVTRLRRCTWDPGLKVAALQDEAAVRGWWEGGRGGVMRQHTHVAAVHV